MVMQCMHLMPFDPTVLTDLSPHNRHSWSLLVFFGLFWSLLALLNTQFPQKAGTHSDCQCVRLYGFLLFYELDELIFLCTMFRIVSMNGLWDSYHAPRLTNLLLQTCSCKRLPRDVALADMCPFVVSLNYVSAVDPCPNIGS